MDARLLGRPRSHSGNSQEWNASKFVFKSYIGVVAHPMLAAMIHAETLNEPILLSGHSPEDAQLSRSLSFLLPQVLSEPPLQLMMNVGDQNGLEAWRLCWYVRNSPCPERTGLRRCNLSCSSSSHLVFEKLERRVENIVRRSQTRSRKQSSSHRCLLRSELTWNCRPSHEPQILVNLMSSLSKIRTATTSPNAAALGRVPMESGWVKNKEKGQEQGERERRRQEQRKGAMRNRRKRSSKGVVTIAENGVTNAANGWHRKEKQVDTKFKATLARPVQAVRRLHWRPQMQAQKRWDSSSP